MDLTLGKQLTAESDSSFPPWIPLLDIYIAQAISELYKKFAAFPSSHMDSRQAGVRPYVLFCSVIASLGTFSSGVNTSAFNIPGSYVRNCEPDPSAALPLCIPMSDWVW